MSIALAVLSSILYGSADYLGGTTARRLHVLQVVAVSAPASLAIELVVLPVFGASWSSATLLWGILSGVCSASAFSLLYLALARGPMAVLSPITAAVSAAVPVIVGLATSTRAPGALEVIGLVLAAPAIFLLSWAPSVEGQPRIRLSSVLIAVGAGLAIGVQLACLRQAPVDSGVAPLILGRGTASVILGVAAVIVLPRANAGRPAPSAIAIAAAAGVLDSLANLTFLFSARLGELAVSGLIVALYPASTVILARVFLHERIAARAYAGIALALVAVALLAL